MSSQSPLQSKEGPEDSKYFAANPPPAGLSQNTSLVEEFINRHSSNRIVLVTSGGTTVPLEHKTVRFIDNFSAGTRGAISAEVFLENGYAVIFLHRESSLSPFARHWSQPGSSLLDFLTTKPDGSVVVDSQYQAKMGDVLKRYTAVKDRLLLLSFKTITDYLHELRAIASLMNSVGSNSLFYLAAAVSDFFIPPERMPTHKIQSTDISSIAKQTKSLAEEEFDNFDSTTAVPRSKSLVIDLDPVPKFLKTLVDDWAPKCMVVSYKLETDPELLIAKAKMALERYHHDLVIGNLLETRKREVVFVTSGKEEEWIRLPESVDQNDEPAIEIESLIVPALIRLHDGYIQKLKTEV